MCRLENLAGRLRTSLRFSLDRVEQHSRLPQVRRVETLGEPAADRPEKVTHLIASALSPPEPGKAGQCSQMQRSGALSLIHI